MIYLQTVYLSPLYIIHLLIAKCHLDIVVLLLVFTHLDQSGTRDSLILQSISNTIINIISPCTNSCRCWIDWVHRLKGRINNLYCMKYVSHQNFTMNCSVIVILKNVLFFSQVSFIHHLR